MYEVRPYGYVVIGLIAILNAGGSTMGILSSLLLLAGSSIIIYSRLKFRGMISN